MTVDFNNLRRQALYAHDKLVNKLNEAIIKKDSEEYAKPNGYDHYMNLGGYVLINADELSETMNDLRMLIASIASVYEPGDENFQDVYSEHYPDDKRLATFNEEV